MWMPPNHLVVDFADHLGDSEAPFFLRDLRMKHNLQEQIAHLLRKLAIIAAFERF
jgi:hypothetical protein